MNDRPWPNQFYWRREEVALTTKFYQALSSKIGDGHGNIPQDLGTSLLRRLHEFQIYQLIQDGTVKSGISCTEAQIYLEIWDTYRRLNIFCYRDGRVKLETGIDFEGVWEAKTKVLLDYTRTDSLQSLDPKKIYHAHYFHQTIGEFSENYRKFLNGVFASLYNFVGLDEPRKYPFPPEAEKKRMEHLDLKQSDSGFAADTQVLSLRIPLSDAKNGGAPVGQEDFLYFVKVYKYFPCLGSVLSIIPASRKESAMQIAFANVGREVKVKEVFAVNRENPAQVISLAMEHSEYNLLREGSLHSPRFSSADILERLDITKFPVILNSPMNKFTTFLSTMIWGIADQVQDLLEKSGILRADRTNLDALYTTVDQFLRTSQVHELRSTLKTTWRGFLKLEDAVFGRNPHYTDTTSILDRLVNRGEESAIIQLVGPHVTNHPGLKKLFSKCPKAYADPEKSREVANFFAIAAQVAKKAGAAGIDINCGCPANYINSWGGGATLMKYPEMVRKIIAAVKAAVGADFPVGVKMRNHARIADFVTMCLEANVSWIAVHPNTKEQGYRYHTLDNEALKICKALVDDFNHRHAARIRFIVNGGMLAETDMVEKLHKIGDGGISLMVARALRGNPFFLNQAEKFLQKRENMAPLEPLAMSILGILHLRYLHEYEGILNLPVLTRFAQEYYRTFFAFQDVPKAMTFEIAILEAKNLKDLEILLMKAACER